jgi:hypothetical protein
LNHKVFILEICKFEDSFDESRISDIFGKKIYGNVDFTNKVQDTIIEMETKPDKPDKSLDKLKTFVTKKMQ